MKRFKIDTKKTEFTFYFDNCIIKHNFNKKKKRFQQNYIYD